MKLRTKLFTLLLIVVLTFTLCSCGGGGGDKPVTPPSGSYTVTYNLNYGTPPQKVTSTVKAGEKAVAINPTRSDIVDPAPFVRDYSDPNNLDTYYSIISGAANEGKQITNGVIGWYTDKNCTSKYDFSKPVNSNIELFAKWGKEYVFEAEHTNLVYMEDQVDEFGEVVASAGENIRGMGASGGAEGPDMVDSPPVPRIGINPSNGYYVTYLFAKGITVFFKINSDVAVNDAILVFRITAETVPYILSPVDDTSKKETVGEMEIPYSGYEIKCNNTLIDYPVVKVLDVTGHTASGGQRPFSDFVLTTSLNLKAGENVITFTTNNNNGMGGTMSATAPVIDCIKIATTANLSWAEGSPNLTNQEGQ